MVLHKNFFLIFSALILNVIQVFNSEIFLLYPRGFSIHVDHLPTTSEVNFEVNVTTTKVNSTVGVYNKKVGQSFGNKWTFSKRNAKFSIGDILYYRIFTMETNNNHRYESGMCPVKKLPLATSLQQHGWVFNFDVSLECSVVEQRSSIQQASAERSNPAEDAEMKVKLDNCQESIFNSSLSLLALQIEVNELRNITQQLINFEETYPLAKQLTLSGRIPPEGDPVETVSFMLYEKLNLKPTVVSAFRDSTYSIRFTVSSVIEKFEILEVAKYTLPATRIIIS